MMWGESKPMLKSRGGGAGVADVEADYFPPTPRKDWSAGLVKLVTAMVIFMAGVVIGLSLSANVSRYYYNSHTELFFPATTYGACDRADCAPTFKDFVRPPHLAHTMSDGELFWRASLVPKAEEFPFQRVPKVAFLFMTRGPLPFAPLWDRFFRGHQGLYSVYVHTLPDYKLNASKSSAFYGRQIPSEIVADYKYYSIFRKHCRPSCYPDEHYIPTYLHLFHGSLNANRTITWVDWSRGGPHPARYGAANINVEFIQAIRNNGTRCTYNSKPTSVCYLFARKFAPSALEPLMNLTSTVLDF